MPVLLRIRPKFIAAHLSIRVRASHERREDDEDAEDPKREHGRCGI
jgi:hypothetical protein